MRDAYRDQLDAVVDDLVAMATEVRQAVRASTGALLSGDATLAERVIRDDLAIDAARERVEESAFELLALQQPVATDLRMLVAALRMVADLERMGDLAVHVAKVARRRVPSTAVPEEMVPTVIRMAKIAERMLGKVASIIADRDMDGALQLEEDDQEMDDLRRASFRVMLGDSWSHGVEAAIDMALLGRYYERIADHTVSLARRVVYLVTGEVAAR